MILVHCIIEMSYVNHPPDVCPVALFSPHTITDDVDTLFDRLDLENVVHL